MCLLLCEFFFSGWIFFQADGYCAIGRRHASRVVKYKYFHHVRRARTQGTYSSYVRRARTCTYCTGTTPRRRRPHPPPPPRLRIVKVRIAAGHGARIGSRWRGDVFFAVRIPPRSLPPRSLRWRPRRRYLPRRHRPPRSRSLRGRPLHILRPEGAFFIRFGCPRVPLEHHLGTLWGHFWWIYAHFGSTCSEHVLLWAPGVRFGG